MNTLKKACLLVLVTLICLACSERSTFDLKLEKEKILKLHHAQRDYHFNKDSIAFANQHSEHFISVNRGKISRPKRAASIARLNRYFSSIEFIKWDDVSEPIIKFSDDGSMAYTIVDKLVRLNYIDEKGDTLEDETHFAWTSIYKKYNGKWKIDLVTSTNMP